MNQDEIDAINGRMAALSLTLTAVIQTLPAVKAAEAAVALKMNQLDSQKSDAGGGTSHKEAATRDVLVESYLQLLSAVARAR